MSFFRITYSSLQSIEVDFPMSHFGNTVHKLLINHKEHKEGYSIISIEYLGDITINTYFKIFWDNYNPKVRINFPYDKTTLICKKEVKGISGEFKKIELK